MNEVYFVMTLKIMSHSASSSSSSPFMVFPFKSLVENKGKMVSKQFLKTAKAIYSFN